MAIEGMQEKRIEDLGIWKNVESEHSHAKAFFEHDRNRREMLWEELRKEMKDKWDPEDSHTNNVLLDKVMDSVYQYTRLVKYKGEFDKADEREQDAMIKSILDDKDLLDRVIDVVVGQYEGAPKPLSPDVWKEENANLLRGYGNKEKESLYETYKKNWKPKKT
jgi:hypothetical protein